MKRGSFLLEILVAFALASLIILIILVSTTTINKVSSVLYKKYDISLKSKILLNRISKELAKNSPPVFGKNPIINLTNNTVEFYTVRISPNSDNITPIIITLMVNSTPSGKGILHILTKQEKDIAGNPLNTAEQQMFFIESEISKFEFANLENVAVRIYLKNRFILRNQKYEIYYKVDVPINIE